MTVGLLTSRYCIRSFWYVWITHYGDVIYVPNTSPMISHCRGDNLVNKFANLYGIYSFVCKRLELILQGGDPVYTISFNFIFSPLKIENETFSSIHAKHCILMYYDHISVSKHTQTKLTFVPSKRRICSATALNNVHEIWKNDINSPSHAWNISLYKSPCPAPPLHFF